MPDLINPLFRKYWWQFLLQTLMIIVIIFSIIAILFYIEKSTISLLTAIGISSLASSCFILFALPQSAAAVSHRSVGGYALAMICGVAFHALAVHIHGEAFLANVIIYGLAASLAAGVTILFMGIFRLEHPPAIAFALGLVIQEWNIRILLVVAISIILLALLKFSLRHVLINIA